MLMVATLTVLDRSERRAVSIPATVRYEGTPEDVRVLDLSTTGFRTSAALELDIGDRVSIGWAGGGRHEASLVRKDPSAYGFVFACELNPALVANARAQHNVVAFDIDHVVASVAVDDTPEPIVALWSPKTRVLFIAAAALLSWTSVLGVAALAGAF